MIADLVVLTATSATTAATATTACSHRCQESLLLLTLLANKDRMRCGVVSGSWGTDRASACEGGRKSSSVDLHVGQ